MQVSGLTCLVHFRRAGRWRHALLAAALIAMAAPAAADDAAELMAAGAGPAERVALPTGARLLPDLAYGSATRQRLDVYVPDAAHARGAPIILMVHGGAWRTGDKAARGVVAHKVGRWVARGFIVVSANYRLLPQADPLVQARDVAQALAFVQRSARDWGGDARLVILMGHSAGAHLVALLNADSGLARPAGAAPWLGAVALDSAVLDVESVMRRPHLRFYDAAFGRDPQFWRAASPLAALTRGAAPLLAVCSTERRDRPCDAANRLAAQAATLGARVEVLGQAKTHAAINADLGLPGAYTEAVEAFMAALDPGVRVRLAP